MNQLTTRFKKMKNRKGFTLVELIVVIVIIGILAAILIPRLTEFVNKADDTQALVVAKEVATAYDSLAAENGGSYSSIAKSSVISLAGITVDGTEIKAVNLTDGAVTVITKNGQAGRTAYNGQIKTQ